MSYLSSRLQHRSAAVKTILISSFVALVGVTGVALAQSDSRMPLLGSPHRTKIHSVEYIITWKVHDVPPGTKLSGYYQTGKRNPETGQLQLVKQNFRNLKQPIQIRFYLEPGIPVQAGIISYVPPGARNPSITMHRNGKYFCGVSGKINKKSYVFADIGCFKAF